MKAIILNSGMGTRMGKLTEEQPKCMTNVYGEESILSRQLRMLYDNGINEIIITTGAFSEMLEKYCNSLELPLRITYVHNALYRETNYIYSIYLAREFMRGQDVLLMHGDLVFDQSVLHDMLICPDSCMVVSSIQKLPEKDFKAVIKEGHIHKIGVEFFEDAVAAQPLYKLNKKEVNLWLDSIVQFCERREVKCYAESAFNEVSEQCKIVPLDVKETLCEEIDNIEDLERISEKIRKKEVNTVYICFSTDIVHSAHIEIIKKAQKLGKIIIGVMTDEATASYKRFPLVPFEERKILFQNLAGVYKVVPQDTLGYKKNIEKYRPDYIVHGDDWKEGFLKPVRDEVVKALEVYGGKLIEYPYATDFKYKEIDARARKELALSDVRRARLRKIISLKGTITALEAHSGITGLIVENTIVYENGRARQFDAMWISSLCDSTAKGKPDIELVDMSSRFRTIDDILEVTTKPIIFDGDTGGLTEHFVYTVKTLERMGVSMVIIEDKTGLKKNSLFGTEVAQTQDTIENFCEKIRAGKKAQKTLDFMICARIESLILERGMEDALERASAYVNAGADAIMIHSRRKEPQEIFEFIEKFRLKDAKTVLVVVPTSFSSVTEEEFKRRGVNVVIYANQLTRAGFPSMQRAAQSILMHHRAQECDEFCMSIKDIINLIPDEK